MLILSNGRNRGVVKAIVLIVVALIVLGYFGFNLRQIIGSPTVRDNLAYGREVALTVWNSYLKAPVTYVWDNLVVKNILSSWLEPHK